MTPRTQAQEDAHQLLYQILHEGHEMVEGSAIPSVFDDDETRAGKAVMLLVSVGALKQNPYFVSDGPAWKYSAYIVETRAHLILDSLTSGENPFRAHSGSHTGDHYTTNIHSNAGAVAVGRGATANYLGGGADGQQVAELLQQMRAVISGLPREAKEDGEHQLQKLGEAAQEGPEALRRRQHSFVGYLSSLKEGVETAAAMMTLYKIGVVLFGVVGVTLPELPPGL